MSVERSVGAEVRPKAPADRSDRAIAEASRPHHQILTLAQLQALGLSARAVRHRLASGRLVRLHQGVYGIGRPTQEGRWMAAVLACGPGAVLSYRSAAELWELLPKRSAPVHVTVPTRTGRRRLGVEVHAGRFEEDETALRHGLPCTSVTRTLIDLASSLERRALERAIDQAEALSLFDLYGLTAALKRHRRRRGIRVLREVLTEYSEPTITASEAEERFLALVRAAGLPRPTVNCPLTLADGTVYRPDFLWPSERLIVEVDGRAYHARRRSFEQDRERDRKLALAGYETRRFAASEIVRRPSSVTAQTAQFLCIAAARVGENGRHPAETGHSPRANGFG